MAFPRRTLVELNRVLSLKEKIDFINMMLEGQEHGQALIKHLSSRGIEVMSEIETVKHPDGSETRTYWTPRGIIKKHLPKVFLSRTKAL